MKSGQTGDSQVSVFVAPLRLSQKAAVMIQDAPGSQGNRRRTQDFDEVIREQKETCLPASKITYQNHDINDLTESCTSWDLNSRILK